MNNKFIKMKLSILSNILFPKKIFILIFTFLLLKICNAQNFDSNKLRFCIGKVNAINQLVNDDRIKNKVIINKVLEDDEFNTVWTGLVNATRKFSKIEFGKDYQIYSIPGETYSWWNFLFVTTNIIKVSRYDGCCGTSYSSNFELTYDLSNNNYDLKIINSYGGINSDLSQINYVIKNDKIIRKYNTK